MENFSGAGVLDCQKVSVQGLPSEAFEGGAGSWAELAGLGLEVRTIDVVAHQGVTGMGEMDPDLVGAAGFELAGEEGGDGLAVPAIENLPRLPMGDGLAPALANRHLLAGMGVTIDRRINGPMPAVGRSPGEGQIAPSQCAGAPMVGKLRAERLMRGVVLRGHHQSRRILVEPMYDAGAAHAADAGQTGAAMGDQGVDQCSGLVARGGVHDKSLRLVDDDEVLVLVDDVERNGLAFRLGRPCRRHVDCDRIPRGDMICGVANRGRVARSLCHRAMSGSRFSDEDLARENERFQPRSRQLGAVNREDAVQARRSLVAGDGDLASLTAIR